MAHPSWPSHLQEDLGDRLGRPILREILAPILAALLSWPSKSYLQSAPVSHARGQERSGLQGLGCARGSAPEHFSEVYRPRSCSPPPGQGRRLLGRRLPALLQPEPVYFGIRAPLVSTTIWQRAGKSLASPIRPRAHTRSKSSLFPSV